MERAKKGGIYINVSELYEMHVYCLTSIKKALNFY